MQKKDQAGCSFAGPIRVKLRRIFPELKTAFFASFGSVVVFAIAANAVPVGGSHLRQKKSSSMLIPVQDGPKLVVQNVSAPQSGPVALDITVKYNETGGYAFLMFRNLPDGFNFSTGFRVQNSWMVSLRDARGLELIPPKDYVGQLELTVLLVRGRNDTVESRKMLVSIGEPVVTGSLGNNEASVVTPQVTLDASEKTSPAAAGQQSIGLEIPSKLMISPVEEQKLLERASSLAEIGDIASARLLFEHLARQGSGRGALALAQTFDPIYFNTINTMGGPKSDIEKARVWYQVAIRLGQSEASSRLTALAEK